MDWLSPHVCFTRDLQKLMHDACARGQVLVYNNVNINSHLCILTDREKINLDININVILLTASTKSADIPMLSSTSSGLQPNRSQTIFRHEIKFCKKASQFTVTVCQTCFLFVFQYGIQDIRSEKWFGRVRSTLHLGPGQTIKFHNQCWPFGHVQKHYCPTTCSVVKCCKLLQLVKKQKKCLTSNVKKVAKRSNIAWQGKMNRICSMMFLKKVQKHFLLEARKKCWTSNVFEHSQTVKHFAWQANLKRWINNVWLFGQGLRGSCLEYV